jgi:hypothetical protein
MKARYTRVTAPAYREGKGLDKATLSEDRYISRRLQKHLGGYMAHELGVAEIRSFLDTAKTSDSLKHKLYKVGSLIFAYGKEQRVLVLNPFDEIDRPKVAYTVPEILEPVQFKSLLETAEEEVPELIPFLAMAGFAGVRRSELVREYAEDQVIWKHLLEKKVRVGLRFGARLALPSPADISLGACCQSCLVSFSEYCLPARLNSTRAWSVFRASVHASRALPPSRQ